MSLCDNILQEGKKFKVEDEINIDFWFIDLIHPERFTNVGFGSKALHTYSYTHLQWALKTDNHSFSPKTIFPAGLNTLAGILVQM